MGDPWQKNALGWVPLVEVGVGQKETLQRTHMFKGMGVAGLPALGGAGRAGMWTVRVVLEAGLGGNVVASASCLEGLGLMADLPQ